MQKSLQEKIDKLNQEAWDLRVYDSARSLELCQESLQLARSINYKRGIAEAARSLGFSYLRLAKNDEALPLLKEALPLFESLNDLVGQALITEYLGVIYRNQGHFGEALGLLYKAVDMSHQTGASENEAIQHYQIGVTYKYLGEFEKALDCLFKSIAIHKENKNRLYPSYPINIIGSIYFETHDYEKALQYFKEGLALRQEFGDKLGEAGSLDNIASTYIKLKDYSKAIDYCNQSLAISRITGDKRSEANALQHLAEIYEHTGDKVLAEKNCEESLQIRKVTGDKKGEGEILLFLARLYAQQENGSAHKVLEFLSGALLIAEEIKALGLQSETRFALYKYYLQLQDYKEAVQQLDLHMLLEKDLQKNAINQKVQNLEISRKAEETQRKAEAIGRQNKELTQLNERIEKQKGELERTLEELKAMQSQLIQSEKMASLGELTAGIAHEIQNPLNFVNNFSEVSNELIDEMLEEVEKGNYDEVRSIATDVKQNLEKINHHGKRADGIVKGMLQHSRSSSGQKELTDINSLCDEYLRLAYHGLRAKDKTFNAATKTDYDESIGLIKVIPQDIGRVVLNLITNAFYAVNDKKKQAENYEPVVSVSTKNLSNRIEIKVKDNGKGIPSQVIDKIFQPFFTTKPTGQGTGLGLSLSYDIVTKGHGGDIKVETEEGQGTSFIVSLPTNN